MKKSILSLVAAASILMINPPEADAHQSVRHGHSSRISHARSNYNGHGHFFRGGGGFFPVGPGGRTIHGYPGPFQNRGWSPYGGGAFIGGVPVPIGGPNIYYYQQNFTPQPENLRYHAQPTRTFFIPQPKKKDTYTRH